MASHVIWGQQGDMVAYSSDTNDDAGTLDWLILFTVILFAVVLRFWGLDNVGLHGDEETMALAVSGILDTGHPILPSDMYYSRAPIQLYLMAFSANLFGMSEWALRLPSVIVGCLAVLASYWMGRRFLPVRWAIGVALVVALLPIMISQSQTARMYVFYGAFIALFCVAIFRWERTRSLQSLLLAFVTYLVALQFHSLAVFSSLLFFFPGLAKGSWKLLLQGGAAFAASGLAYFGLNEWINSNYIQALDFSLENQDLARQSVTLVQVRVLSAVALMAIFIGGWFLTSPTLKASVQGLGGLLALFLLATSAIASAAMQYHIAGIAFCVGSVLFVRYGGRASLIAYFATILLCVFAVQLTYLYFTNDFEGPRKILVTMIGQPPPRSYLQFIGFFPLAVAMYVIAFVYFAIEFAKGKPLPDHVLFLLISVWVPLLLIAFFTDFPAHRYVSGFILFFIISAIAAYRALLIPFAQQQRMGIWAVAIGAAALIVVFIKPLEFWRNVNAQYADFIPAGDNRGADHKGAAEFIQNFNFEPTDIIMAEDVLQQVYYLQKGKVDYWLRSFGAGSYAFESNGDILDIYTGTSQLGTAAMLAKVVENSSRGAVYIIGSGETAAKPEWFLGTDIQTLLESYEPETIYLGRDGQTKVWRIPAP